MKLNEINDINQNRENDRLSSEEQSQLEEDAQVKMQEFRSFLETHKDHVDEETIFQVLQSHGKIEECIKYAELIERYDTVIVHYINMQEHTKAIQKVTEIKDEVKRNETMLRYASIFVNKCARETILELQKQAYRRMEIAKIMPAFMNIKGQEDMESALDYIKTFCIDKRSNKSKTVHNMAFYFHSELDDQSGMIEFLEREEEKKAKGHAIYFEVDYALNTCIQKEKNMNQ